MVISFLFVHNKTSQSSDKYVDSIRAYIRVTYMTVYLSIYFTPILFLCSSHTHVFGFLLVLYFVSNIKYEIYHFVFILIFVNLESHCM